MNPICIDETLKAGAAQIGRLEALDDEAIQTAIKEDRIQTCDDLARQFNTPSEMVRLHLHRLGSGRGSRVV
ncbi:hypothetical protein TNCV_3510801 [Trichonephila clavipes]|nr:hypothetical protein TNCV_3510801 [Trichonephila clavipes]